MNEVIKYAGKWNASEFFESLTNANKLCRSENFAFAEISGLKGLTDLLSKSISYNNIIAVDETSEGYLQLMNTPSRRMVKSVYIIMKCAPGNYQAREECFEIMREIFRQFMSVLIRQKTKLLEQNISIDRQIAFNEIDEYFAQGAACAWFGISVDTPVDMRFREDEWEDGSVG